MRHFFLFFFSLLSCISFVLCPFAVLADDVQEDDNTTFTIDFVNTVPTDHISDVVAEWLDVDNTQFTYTDLATRLADAYISYQFAAPSGVASTIKEALKSALWNYIFYVDSQTGYVVAQKEFYHELDAIYSRFGFDNGVSMIGQWVALPVIYQNANDNGGYQYESDYAVYTTFITNGSGGQTGTHYFAIRSASSASGRERPLFDNGNTGLWTNFNISNSYTGTNYSGFYTSRGSGRLLPESQGYANQSAALTDFFGDAEEHGGHVWNGNLYYDDTPHAFTLNNLPTGTGIASDRYNDLVEDDKTPDDDITPYFNGNDTIIYRPIFEDIPNTHDFSFELPSGTIPDLDFEFNYTIQDDTGGSFFAAFDGVFNSSGGILFICVTILGVFLLIEVMT